MHDAYIHCTKVYIRVVILAYIYDVGIIPTNFSLRSYEDFSVYDRIYLIFHGFLYLIFHGFFFLKFS